MQPIDLIDYADHAVKIPSSFLNHVVIPKKVPIWKVMLSHWIDLYAVFSFTVFVTVMLAASNTVYLSSEKLQKIVSTGPGTYVFIFGLLMVSYFFLSYFLNHGQSLGLYSIKKRIPMEEKNIKSAFHWSLVSSLTCLTGGIASIYLELETKLASHDYLYVELLQHKEFSIAILVKESQSKELQEFEEAYKQAA
ncbi:MAG TPA: hypothetical protein VNJ08_12485 [Bacteriovoracaceae bacterium]|nr:hypothetical protein [Bacteriovoracaceae bacterium]